MEQPTVLIIADDPDFSRSLMGRWQMERLVPAFTLMSSELWSGAEAGQFQLAVVGPMRGSRLSAILQALDSGSAPETDSSNASYFFAPGSSAPSTDTVLGTLISPRICS